MSKVHRRHGELRLYQEFCKDGNATKLLIRNSISNPDYVILSKLLKMNHVD